MICYLYKPAGRRIYMACVRLSGDTGKPLRRSLRTSDKRVADKRLQQLRTHLEHEAAGIGIPEPLVQAAKRPLSEHLNDWNSDARTRGRTPEYRRHVVARCRELFASCGWTFPRDVNAESFTRWRDASSHLSACSLNHFLDACRALMLWMHRAGRVTSNPLASLQRVSKEGRETFKRRSLPDDELGRLLATSGDRSIIYFIAATTGLRYIELKKLRRSDALLDADPPQLCLRASITKNRTASVFNLAPLQAQRLREWLSSAPQGDGPLFWKGMPSWATWRGDFERAGIPRFDADGRKSDFHCLRNTFGTNLLRLNTSATVTQTLMRHKDIRHTLQTYPDLRALGVPDALNRLVELTQPAFPRAHDLVSTGRTEASSGTESQNTDDAKPLGFAAEKHSLARSGVHGHDPSQKWSRGESNPRPETVSKSPLRVCLVH